MIMVSEVSPQTDENIQYPTTNNQLPSAREARMAGHQASHSPASHHLLIGYSLLDIGYSVAFEILTHL